MDQNMTQSSDEQQLLEEVSRCRELVQQNPREHKADLAAALYNLGEFYAEENRTADAEPCYLQAVSHYMELAEENPRSTPSIWHGF